MDENLSSPSKLYRIFYLVKMTFIHKGIAEKRLLENNIRKWRFTIFCKIDA
jgi:hypothetical protein